MLDNKMVHYIAELSRLHIDEAEAASLGKDLEAILGYVGQLNSVDVSNVKPTSHVLDMENVFREDEIKPSFANEDALSFAIEHHKGHYKVPKVLE